ncbi:hypothetical protein AAF712_013652 [Marasmius tenuissimus]|uniref:Alpha/beta hydrolase fold-3 domain-containing protein n=1 Tax=Marasmius tenuissimus TaxID=585030 RepID=A0ABR2ZD71_9AGAR
MANASIDGHSDSDAASSSATATSSITITHHTERSRRLSLLQSVMRPFKQYLSKTNEPHDPGSPQLTPHKLCAKTCSVSERQVDGIFIYDVEPNQPIERHPDTPGTSPDTKLRIYYIAGGSWRDPPPPHHWKFIAKLASTLPQTTVTLISPPLAPHETAPTVFPKLLSLYETMMSESRAKGERVVWAGDSSGGNLVLCLVAEALRLGNTTSQTSDSKSSEDKGNFTEIEQKPLAERKGMYPPLPAPAALLLISPSVDGKRDNPDIGKLAEDDPVLIAPQSAQFAADWAGEWSLDDERISPALDESLGQLLFEHGVKVHGVTAGYDILAPDAIKLRDKLGTAGVEGKWLHWEKQFHCFPIAWTYGLPESQQGLEWILEVLREV